MAGQVVIERLVLFLLLPDFLSVRDTTVPDHPFLFQSAICEELGKPLLGALRTGGVAIAWAAAGPGQRDGQ